MVFSVKKEDFSKFKLDLIDQCISALPTRLPLGITGLVIPEAEYLKFKEVTISYVRKIDPARSKPKKPSKLAKGAALKRWDIQQKIYEEDNKEYTAELKAEATIKTLDPVSLLAIKVPSLGNLNISPAEIWKIVQDIHGTQLPDDVDALAIKYREPYVSGDMRMFLANQDNFRRKLDDAGELVPIGAQLRNTIESLEPCGKFVKPIFMWKTLHPTKDVRTLKILHDAVCAAYYDEGNSHTAGSRSVAAATVSSAAATGTAPSTEFTALLASVVAALATTDSKRTSQSAANKSGGKSKANWIHYCWTHGTNCNHSSADCTKALTNSDHKKTATATDKKGGKETPFVPYHQRK